MRQHVTAARSVAEIPGGSLTSRGSGPQNVAMDGAARTVVIKMRFGQRGRLGESGLQSRTFSR